MARDERATEAGGIVGDAAAHELSALVIPLLKGVIYQEGDAGLWNSFLALQVRVPAVGNELRADELACIRPGRFIHGGHACFVLT